MSIRRCPKTVNTVHDEVRNPHNIGLPHDQLHAAPWKGCSGQPDICCACSVPPSIMYGEHCCWHVFGDSIDRDVHPAKVYDRDLFGKGHLLLSGELPRGKS